MYPFMILLVAFAPPLLGLALALPFALGARPRGRSLDGRARTIAALAALLCLVPVLFRLLVMALLLPDGLLAELRSLGGMYTWDHLAFTAPLVAGSLAALLWLAYRSPRPTGATAELSYRGIFDAAPRWLLWLGGALIASALTVALGAGLLSSPDHEGRYTMHTVDVGLMAMSTTIYGWHFSIPALCALAVLVCTGSLALRHLARARLDGHDSSYRRRLSTQLLCLVNGAIALHLAQVVSSLRGPASLRGDAPSGEGRLSVEAPLAPLEDLFLWGGTLLWVAGTALIAVTLWSAILPPRRAARTTASPTERVAAPSA